MENVNRENSEYECKVHTYVSACFNSLQRNISTYISYNISMNTTDK